MNDLAAGTMSARFYASDVAVTFLGYGAVLAAAEGACVCCCVDAAHWVGIISMKVADNIVVWLTYIGS